MPISSEPLSLPNLIGRFPKNYKVCQTCRTIQPLRFGSCVNCDAYRFDSKIEDVRHWLEIIISPDYISAVPEYD